MTQPSVSSRPTASAKSILTAGPKPYRYCSMCFGRIAGCHYKCAECPFFNYCMKCGPNLHDHFMQFVDQCNDNFEEFDKYFEWMNEAPGNLHKARSTYLLDAWKATKAGEKQTNAPISSVSFFPYADGKLPRNITRKWKAVTKGDSASTDASASETVNSQLNAENIEAEQSISKDQAAPIVNNGNNDKEICKSISTSIENNGRLVLAKKTKEGLY